MAPCPTRVIDLGPWSRRCGPRARSSPTCTAARRPAPPRRTATSTSAPHFGGRAPQSWQVDLPARVDLVVLDAAPLYLAGRIALRGRLLFDDDPPRRVCWEAETRVQYWDELPLIEESAHEYLEAVARRGRP